jgi:hypothetical protein
LIAVDDLTQLEAQARRAGVSASQMDGVKENDVFLQLLSQHVLPLAESAIPQDPLATVVQTEAVESVCVHFREYLVKIFQIYGEVPARLANPPQEYDDETGEPLPPPEPSVSDLEMSFDSFVKMCRKFEIVSPQVTNSTLGRLFALCLDDPLGFGSFML